MIKVYYASECSVAACPDSVILPDMNIDVGYREGYTFIAGVNKNGELELIISDTTENTHTMMLTMYTMKNGEKLGYPIEGRFFKTSHGVILTIWSDFSSEEMRTLKELFLNKKGIDISNWIFATEFDDSMAFTCTVEEFISLGLSENWGELDYEKVKDAYEKSNRIPVEVQSTNGLGFDDRDYMRHYLYQEGKINESRASSVLYHFTESYLPIINTDTLYLKCDDTQFFKLPNKIEKKHPYCFSTTRRKNDAEGYSLRFSTDEAVQSYARFTLDGDKINNDKDLIARPYNWFYNDPFGTSAKQEYLDLLQNGEAFQGEIEDTAFKVQSEDRVWSNKMSLSNFSSFVTRVDILIVHGQLSTYVDVINKACKMSKGDWRHKIYIYTNRNDFNAQNNNCFYLEKLAENRITIEDIKYMVNEVIKKMANSDILYRGGISKDYECLWLTTSRQYAEEFARNSNGEIFTYEVPISVLDNLACEDDAMDYLIDEEDRGADPWSTEEFYLYDRNLFDINRMKADGYTGYYYHEDEYKCINVCLFRDTQFKLIKQEKPQN